MACQKPALGHASAIQVTTFGCFAGTTVCLPFAGQLVSQLGSAPAGDTLNVVYLGLFPTMLGFTTWAYALARTPSPKMVSRGRQRSPAPREEPDPATSTAA